MMTVLLAGQSHNRMPTLTVLLAGQSLTQNRMPHTDSALGRSVSYTQQDATH
jgi:hypothetical protein